jgi:alanine racemase
MRPIRARIDLKALRHNLLVARHHAPNAKIMAVVKANAYGHGLARVARGLRDADAFGILELDAAIRLREAGYAHRIVLLEGFFTSSELETIADHRLSTVVHSMEQVRVLRTTRLKQKLEVHLKINTGMNRLGVAVSEVPRAVQLLQTAQIAQVTLMTHFACAEERDGASEQLQRFEQATAGLQLPRSLANSAALLRHPSTHADWVRPGIMLYGASPFDDQGADELGLRPVMTLESELIAVRQLAAGDAVGYAGTFRAPQAMRAGIVACGYADGYPRHASTGAPVLVAGVRTRLLGRVSMDMLCVDLTGLPEADIGSNVTLWGAGLPVEEVAASAGTVSYELLCALAARVPITEIDA